RHVMLPKVFLRLCLTSCFQKQLGPKPIHITLYAFQDDFEPTIARSIIPEEQIRPVQATSPIADKEIQKTVVVIINKAGIASSPYTWLGSHPGSQSDIGKGAVAIVPKETIGDGCSLYSVDDI